VKANCARASATGSKPLTTPPYLPPPVAPLAPGAGACPKGGQLNLIERIIHRQTA
jgi:hypothetical protein